MEMGALPLKPRQGNDSPAPPAAAMLLHGSGTCQGPGKALPPRRGTGRRPGYFSV